MLRKLENLGLTEGEAKVYLAMLKTGPSSVGPIVKESGVAYSNIYEILNRLIEKGLASHIIKEKTKHYQAGSPQSLQEFLEKKEKEIQDKQNILQEILPRLEKKAKQEQEETRVFVGKKGLFTAYEHLLESDDKTGYFFYVHEKESAEQAERFYTQLWKMLRKKKVIWKGVGEQEFRKTTLVKKYPSFIKQKYVSYPVPGTIDIFGDKVLITTWKKKPTGILIQSKEIAENYKKYFEKVWKEAK